MKEGRKKGRGANQEFLNCNKYIYILIKERRKRMDERRNEGMNNESQTIASPYETYRRNQRRVTKYWRVDDREQKGRGREEGRKVSRK